MDIIIFTENGHKRKGIIKSCPCCQKPFSSRINGGKNFCSNECRGKSKRNRIKIKCLWCKKEFERTASKVGTLSFCGRKCKECAQRLGGLLELQLPHYGTGYSNYQNLIERTNNPCCLDCKENRLYLLCVHHIDGNRTNNHKDNLEIVCFNCHVKRHLKFVDNKWVYLGKYLTPRELLETL